MVFFSNLRLKRNLFGVEKTLEVEKDQFGVEKHPVLDLKHDGICADNLDHEAVIQQLCRDMRQHNYWTIGKFAKETTSRWKREKMTVRLLGIFV